MDIAGVLLKGLILSTLKLGSFQEKGRRCTELCALESMVGLSLWLDWMILVIFSLDDLSDFFQP